MKRLWIAVLFTCASAHAADHVGTCTERTGIDKARCERHSIMAKKCGALRGDAHFSCDREFLIANPLDCNQLTDNGKDKDKDKDKDKGKGKAKASCEAEGNAFKTCEAQLGIAFMKCVKTTTGESPLGH